MAKILVHATHGKEDPERATLPFVLGNVSATADQETVVLLTIEGVRLATYGYADEIHKDGFPALSLPVGGLVIETRNGRARVTAKEVPLTQFADLLSGQLGRPVVDMTGLAGNYSFVAYFTPEGPNSADGSEPSIFAALQEQLGLRLEARKGPVELLVINHAEKIPTGN